MAERIKEMRLDVDREVIYLSEKTMSRIVEHFAVTEGAVRTLYGEAMANNQVRIFLLDAKECKGACCESRPAPTESSRPAAQRRNLMGDTWIG